MKKTIEEMQELIDLTPEQKKAFSALQRAVKRCLKENVCFYQTLETLYGLNGNNVSDVSPEYGEAHGLNGDNEAVNFIMPSVDTICSFADDDHYVYFHDNPDKRHTY